MDSSLPSNSAMRSFRLAACRSCAGVNCNRSIAAQLRRPYGNATQYFPTRPLVRKPDPRLSNPPSHPLVAGRRTGQMRATMTQCRGRPRYGRCAGQSRCGAAPCRCRRPRLTGLVMFLPTLWPRRQSILRQQMACEEPQRLQNLGRWTAW
jgi:hypothetical protein